MNRKTLPILLVSFMVLALAACAPGRVADREAGMAAAGERGFSDVLGDQRLRGRIQAFILRDDELLDESNVTITVFNRIVLLTGEVPNRDAGARLARHARDQGDARFVYNELVVAPLSSVLSRGRDGVIATAARTQIMTLDTLPREFDRERIRIVVERQRLYLMGTVTRDEANIITDAVRRVRGVREVVRLFEYAD